jgi:restriction system protein
MSRAGRRSEDLEAFLEEGLVAVGDPKAGPFPAALDKEALQALYAAAYPEMKEGTRASTVHPLLRYVSEVKLGDGVIT